MSSCTWLREAVAQSEVPSARLEVEASVDCATRDDLIARVQTRAPRVKFDESGGVGVRARFSVAPSGSVIANVVLGAPGSPRSARRVLAASCREAADAVALIIAVTLDPTALVNPTGTDATRRKPGEARPGAAAPPASQASKPAESSSQSDPATLAPDDDEPEPSSARGRQTFGFQLAGQALFGPAPGAMPGVALFALIGIDRPALWSPAVLLGASHAWRSHVPAQGGVAAFTLDAASFDACPFTLRLSALEARPCASALIGRLGASGSETRNQVAESSRPFWVVGGVALLSVRLVRLLEASARVGAGANLVRDSFEFTPAVFHQVPAVTVTANVGIGLRWR